MPTATHDVAVGQLTSLKAPPPELSDATVAEAVHDQTPADSVPIETIPCSTVALSVPTATHVVALAQLTPKKSPPPELSGVTEVEAVHDQAPADSVPIE
jgi:hypothetical protein